MLPGEARQAPAAMGDAVYDEVEIEDMEFVKEKNTFFYPCPCGDKFEITFGVCIPVLQQAREHAPARCHVCVCVCVCVCVRACLRARTRACSVYDTHVDMRCPANM